MQGLILLNFHSKENKKTITDLEKSTGIAKGELVACVDSLVKVGIL
jgi:hypothetical protein